MRLPPSPEAAREREAQLADLPPLALDFPATACLELLLTDLLPAARGFTLTATGDAPALPLSSRSAPPSLPARVRLTDPEGMTLAAMTVSDALPAARGFWLAGEVEGIRLPQHDLFVPLRAGVAHAAELPAGSHGVSLRGAVDDAAMNALLDGLKEAPGVLIMVRDDGDPDHALALRARVESARALGSRLDPRPVRIAIVPETPDAGTGRDEIDPVLATNLGLAAHHLPPAPLPLQAGDGVCVFFTGLSGSGKSTVARALHAHLVETGNRAVTLLDGDVVRRHLSSELGFSREHRDLNIRRIGYVASQIVKHGGVAICAPIAPYAATRAAVREMVQAHGRFIEIHISTPLSVCEARDRKGLYARARAGEIPEFTGISDPYETPESPQLRLDTSTLALEACVERVIAAMAPR